MPALPQSHRSVPKRRRGSLGHDMGVPFLGRIPLDPDVVTQSDAGEPFAMFNSDTADGRGLSRDREQSRNVLQEERVVGERRSQTAAPIKHETDESQRGSDRGSRR